jgi:hypothetical protein
MPINTVYFGYGIVLKDREIFDAICKKLDLPTDSNDDVVYDELNARIGEMLADKYRDTDKNYHNETIPENIFNIVHSDAGSFLYITKHSNSISTHDSEVDLGEGQEGDLSLKLGDRMNDAVAMFKSLTGIDAKWSWMLVPDFIP